MKKSLKKKIGLLVAALILFFVYLQYNSYKNTHFKIDKKAFHAMTMKDYMKDIVQQSPQLTMVNAFHLFNSPNKEITLPEQQRTIRLEKTWVDNGEVFIIYSTNIKNTDKKAEDIPFLDVNSLTFHTKNGKNIEVKVSKPQDGLLAQNKGIIGHAIGRRLYRSMKLYINFDTSKYNGTDFFKLIKEDLPKLQDITLKDVKWGTDPDQMTSIKNMTMPATFFALDKLLKTEPINKELVFNNGLKVKLKDAKIYAYGAQIDIEPEQDTNANMTNFDFDYYVNNSIKPAGGRSDFSSKTMFLGMLDSFPAKIKLNVSQYYYSNGEKLDVTIDKKRINSMLNGSEIPLGTIKNAHVYLGMDQNYPNAIYIKVKIDNYGDDSPSLDFLRLEKSDMGTTININGNNPSTLKLTDGDGKDLNSTQVSHWEEGLDFKSLTINVDPTELAALNKLHIEISPWYYQKNLGTPVSVKFELK